MKTKAIICIFMLLHLLSYAQNKTYYISSNGNDINNGLSSTTPWQTLSKIDMQHGKIVPAPRLTAR